MENNALRDQPTPRHLAALLADYLRHAVQHGYSLRPKTLALRSLAYFDGAMSPVRARAFRAHACCAACVACVGDSA